MARSRAIRGVLGNFLGTYTSRYTDFDGYWLFGFLVAGLVELRIDLLATPDGEHDTALGVAVRSAGAKFADQVCKAGLRPSQLREARLTIRRQPDSAVVSINGHPRPAHRLSFVAEAVAESGRRYEREWVAFVAPHDPGVELRSARVAEPGAAPGCGGT